MIGGKSDGTMRYIRDVFIEDKYNIKLVHKRAPRVARDRVSSCSLWMQLAGILLLADLVAFRYYNI